MTVLEQNILFYNDFKGANTRGHEISHFCENQNSHVFTCPPNTQKTIAY